MLIDETNAMAKELIDWTERLMPIQRQYFDELLEARDHGTQEELEEKKRLFLQVGDDIRRLSAFGTLLSKLTTETLLSPSLSRPLHNSHLRGAVDTKEGVEQDKLTNICTICGKNLPTQRGLSIHQGRSHARK
jgi:hypothetical protein